jgi:TPR repeat protein
MTEEAQEHKARVALESGAYQEAVSLLYPLAEANSEFALLGLGWIYETGNGVSPNDSIAKSFYERAVSAGSIVGCFELGRILLKQGDKEGARFAFAKGSELGDLPSMSRLGKMMVEGRGGSTDADTGIAWLEKAAVGGHILAQRHLIDIQLRKTKSVFRKLLLRFRIAALVRKGAQEILKNPESDKIR